MSMRTHYAQLYALCHLGCTLAIVGLLTTYELGCIPRQFPNRDIIQFQVSAEKMRAGSLMGKAPPVYQFLTGWWFGTWLGYDFPYIGNVIIPTDFHIFQRGRSTTNQLSIALWSLFVKTRLASLIDWCHGGIRVEMAGTPSHDCRGRSWIPSCHQFGPIWSNRLSAVLPRWTLRA